MKAILTFLTNLGLITWWLTPFTFIYSLVNAITSASKNENNIKHIIIAYISLILILSIFIYNLLYAK